MPQHKGQEKARPVAKFEYSSWSAGRALRARSVISREKKHNGEKSVRAILSLQPVSGVRGNPIESALRASRNRYQSARGFSRNQRSTGATRRAPTSHAPRKGVSALVEQSIAEFTRSSTHGGDNGGLLSWRPRPRPGSPLPEQSGVN